VTPAYPNFPIGTGYWTRANPEVCLLATRGKPKRLSAAVRKLIVAPRREHSRKPDELHERIEALVGGPYLEMFARFPRPGWDSCGLEAETGVGQRRWSASGYPDEVADRYRFR
jgi:N6-adenosine-specific RNA methylase IME4